MRFTTRHVLVGSPGVKWRGITPDLRSGTSCLRSTTSNNRSGTSHLRSGTFFCWDPPLCTVYIWSAVGNPTSAFGPSGSSFGPSSLSPTGIHHLLLSNLTTVVHTDTTVTCTRLFYTYEMSHPAFTPQPHSSFPVPRRVGGWVGLRFALAVVIDTLATPDFPRRRVSAARRGHHISFLISVAGQRKAVAPGMQQARGSQNSLLPKYFND